MSGWTRLERDDDDDDGGDDEAAPPPAPDPRQSADAPEGTAPPPPPAPCWNCATPVPADLPGCPSCGRTRTHLTLTCAAPRLELAVGAGSPLRVGRDPAWAPHTATPLSALPRVSRRQVTLQIEPDGTAWAEEPAKGTSNGTYVAGTLLRPGTRLPLYDGDEIRVGREVVRFRVRLHGPGPTPAAPDPTTPTPP